MTPLWKLVSDEPADNGLINVQLPLVHPHKATVVRFTSRTENDLLAGRL